MSEKSKNDQVIPQEPQEKKEEPLEGETVEVDETVDSKKEELESDQEQEQKEDSLLQVKGKNAFPDDKRSGNAFDGYIKEIGAMVEGLGNPSDESVVLAVKDFFEDNPAKAKTSAGQFILERIKQESEKEDISNEKSEQESASEAPPEEGSGKKSGKEVPQTMEEFERGEIKISTEEEKQYYGDEETGIDLEITSFDPKTGQVEVVFYEHMKTDSVEEGQNVVVFGEGDQRKEKMSYSQFAEMMKNYQKILIEEDEEQVEISQQEEGDLKKDVSEESSEEQEEVQQAEEVKEDKKNADVEKKEDVELVIEKGKIFKDEKGNKIKIIEIDPRKNNKPQKGSLKVRLEGVDEEGEKVSQVRVLSRKRIEGTLEKGGFQEVNTGIKIGPKGTVWSDGKNEFTILRFENSKQKKEKLVVIRYKDGSGEDMEERELKEKIDKEGWQKKEKKSTKDKEGEKESTPDPEEKTNAVQPESEDVEQQTDLGNEQAADETENEEESVEEEKKESSEELKPEESADDQSQQEKPTGKGIMFGGDPAQAKREEEAELAREMEEERQKEEEKRKERKEKEAKESLEREEESLRQEMDRWHGKVVDLQRSLHRAKKEKKSLSAIRKILPGKDKGEIYEAEREYKEVKASEQVARDNFKEAHIKYASFLFQNKEWEILEKEEGSALDQEKADKKDSLKDALRDFFVNEGVIPRMIKKEGEGGEVEEVEEKVSLLFDMNQRILEIDKARADVAEGSSKEVFKKVSSWWMEMPKKKRIAIGAALAGTAVFAGGLASGIGISAAATAGGAAGARRVLSSVVGMVFTGGTYKLSQEYLEGRREKKEEKREKKAVEKYIKEKKVDLYSLMNDRLSQERKDTRNSLIAAGAVGIGAGMGTRALFEMDFPSGAPDDSDAKSAGSSTEKGSVTSEEVTETNSNIPEEELFQEQPENEPTPIEEQITEVKEELPDEKKEVTKEEIAEKEEAVTQPEQEEEVTDPRKLYKQDFSKMSKDKLEGIVSGWQEKRGSGDMPSLAEDRAYKKALRALSFREQQEDLSVSQDAQGEEVVDVQDKTEKETSKQEDASSEEIPEEELFQEQTDEEPVTEEPTTEESAAEEAATESEPQEDQSSSHKVDVVGQDVFAVKLEKGETVWGKLENHFEGDQQKTAQALFEFKKEMASNLANSHGLNENQAKQFIEWRFKHMEIGEEIFVQNNQLQIDGFVNAERVAIFNQETGSEDVFVAEQKGAPVDSKVPEENLSQQATEDAQIETVSENGLEELTNKQLKRLEKTRAIVLVQQIEDIESGHVSDSKIDKSVLRELVKMKDQMNEPTPRMNSAQYVQKYLEKGNSITKKSLTELASLAHDEKFKNS